MNTAASQLPGQDPSPFPAVGFIGGGNMASAIIGGLIRKGSPATNFEVVEPFEQARAKLAEELGVTAQPVAGPTLSRCAILVWAIKPQNFAAATQPIRELSLSALHLSVAAGIPSASIARWLGSDRVVRAMPNTPALVGQGMTGLFARGAVDDRGRKLAEQVLEATGDLIWVESEDALDAVTAVSGSGPAYVFYFIEAMTEAGIELGLPADQAQRLAVGTFRGASALASSSQEAPSILRSRVTSKGGTTHAAIAELDRTLVKEKFKSAIRAAHRRAGELAEEFGRG